MLTDTLQNIHRTHHIRFISPHRIFVGFPHDGLCRQMKHNLRLRLIEHFHQMVPVPDISYDGIHMFFHPADGKQVRLRRRVQRIARHLGARAN